MKLDTQAVKMPTDEIIRREVDKAWLAGIIDGEGTIEAALRKSYNPKVTNPDARRIEIMMTIVNTDSRIIEKATEILKDNDIKPIVYWLKRSKKNMKCRDLGVVRVTGFTKLTKTLTMVLPYLVSYKKEQSLEVLSLIQYRQTLPYHNGNGSLKSDGTRREGRKSICDNPVIQAKIARIRELCQPLNDYTPCPDNSGDDIVSSVK